MADEPKLQELDKLIAKGKEKGYLTYDEVNDALPSDIVSLDQLDDIMMLFGSMDIEVVDSAKAGRLPSEGGAGQAADPEPDDDEPAEPRRIDLTPGPVGRTEDPVRLYLREMGRVSLLTREGEITLAKRIEEGKDEATRAILSTTLALDKIRAVRDELRKDLIPIKDLVDYPEEGVHRGEGGRPAALGDARARHGRPALARARNPPRPRAKASRQGGRAQEAQGRAAVEETRGRSPSQAGESAPNPPHPQPPALPPRSVGSRPQEARREDPGGRARDRAVVRRQAPRARRGGCLPRFALRGPRGRRPRSLPEGGGRGTRPSKSAWCGSPSRRSSAPRRMPRRARTISSGS